MHYVIIHEDLAKDLLRSLNDLKELFKDFSYKMVSQQTDTLLTEKEAATFLKCSITKLRVLRNKAEIEFIKAGRKVIYKRSILEQYLKQQTKFTNQNDFGDDLF